MTTEATLVSFADVKSMVYHGDVHNEISLINQLSYLGGTTLYMGKLFGGMIWKHLWFMLTIPLKSSHHLYLCCLSHDDGPSPSSPSDRGASLCQSNSTFGSSAHGACPNTCASGMIVMILRWSKMVEVFSEKTKKKHMICSTAGIFIITCYSFQEFHAELKVFQSFGSN